MLGMRPPGRLKPDAHVLSLELMKVYTHISSKESKNLSRHVLGPFYQPTRKGKQDIMLSGFTYCIHFLQLLQLHILQFLLVMFGFLFCFL